MTASLTPIGPLYLRQKLTGKRNFGRDCTFTRLDFHARFRASSHLTDPSEVKVNREIVKYVLGRRGLNKNYV